MICLGFIGGLIYVGVVEKVSWKFTGAYLGNVTQFKLLSSARLL